MTPEERARRGSEEMSKTREQQPLVPNFNPLVGPEGNGSGGGGY